jgi:hypothetical protein
MGISERAWGGGGGGGEDKTWLDNEHEVVCPSSITESQVIYRYSGTPFILTSLMRAPLSALTGVWVDCVHAY